MQLTRIFGKAALGLGALMLVACQPAESRRAGLAPETSAVRSASEQREGDQTHPKLVAHFGGACNDPRVTSYLNHYRLTPAGLSACCSIY